MNIRQQVGAIFFAAVLMWVSASATRFYWDICPVTGRLYPVVQYDSGHAIQLKNEFDWAPFLTSSDDLLMRDDCGNSLIHWLVIELYKHDAGFAYRPIFCVVL